MTVLFAIPAIALASWYGAGSGPLTANGERYSSRSMTAACCGPGFAQLPFGTLLRIGYRDRSVIVRINDRGPFIKGRYIDLAEGAARQLGLSGVARVTIKQISFGASS